MKYGIRCYLSELIAGKAKRWRILFGLRGVADLKGLRKDFPNDWKLCSRLARSADGSFSRRQERPMKRWPRPLFAVRWMPVVAGKAKVEEGHHSGDGGITDRADRPQLLKYPMENIVNMIKMERAYQ